jgi:hypothetical protein
MKKILIAAAAMTLMCGAAFAAEGNNSDGSAAARSDQRGQSNVSMTSSGSTQSGSTGSMSGGTTTGSAQDNVKKDDIKTGTSKDDMKK